MAEVEAIQPDVQENEILRIYDKLPLSHKRKNCISHRFGEYLKICGFDKEIYDIADRIDPRVYKMWELYLTTGTRIKFVQLLRKCSEKQWLTSFEKYLSAMETPLTLDTWLSSLPTTLPTTILIKNSNWSSSTKKPSLWKDNMCKDIDYIKRLIYGISTKPLTMNGPSDSKNDDDDITKKTDSAGSDSPNKTITTEYISVKDMKTTIDDFNFAMKLGNVNKATELLAFMVYSFYTDDISYVRSLSNKVTNNEALNVYEAFFYATLDIYLLKERQSELGGVFWGIFQRQKPSIYSVYRNFAVQFFNILHKELCKTSDHIVGKTYCIGFYEIIVLMNKIAKGRPILINRYQSEIYDDPPKILMNGLLPPSEYQTSYYKRTDRIQFYCYPGSDVEIDIKETKFILASGLPRSIAAVTYYQSRVDTSPFTRMFAIPTDDMLTAATFLGVIPGELRNLDRRIVDNLILYSGDNSGKLEQNLIIRSENATVPGCIMRQGSIDQFPNLNKRSIIS